MTLQRRFLFALCVGLLASSGPFSSAFGAFWDPNIVNAKIRSDYPSGYGVGSNILLSYTKSGAEGCLFNATSSFGACPGRRLAPDTPPSAYQYVWYSNLQVSHACGATVAPGTNPVGDSWQQCLQYSQNTHFELNSPTTNYWVIHANNDPSFDLCRAGTPGMSEVITDPTVNPANNLYKVGVTGTGNKVIHLIVAPVQHSYYCPGISAYQASYPFLSVGAHSDKGNGGPIGYVSNSGTTTGSDILHFQAEVVDYATPGCAAGTSSICTTGTPGVHLGVLMMATWSGMRHMLYLDLYGEGSVDNMSRTTFLPGKWNWPLGDSMFFPGAELALLNPTMAATTCGVSAAALTTGSPGPVNTYSFSMSKLFKCASDAGAFPDPMPSGYLPVDAVDWYVEAAGTGGYTWLAIAGIYND
jgi:hypothetical protein